MKGPRIGTGDGDGEHIDREVAPRLVLGKGPLHHLRFPRRLRVALSPSADKLELPTTVLYLSGAEVPEYSGLRSLPQQLGDPVGDPLAVALEDKVQVRRRSVDDQVAHCSADEAYLYAGLLGSTVKYLQQVSTDQ